MKSTLEFSGRPSSVRNWRRKVKAVTGVEGSSVRCAQEYGLMRGYFTAELTNQQRDALMPLWQEGGWNMRIVFRDLDPKKEAANRRRSAAIERACNS